MKREQAPPAADAATHEPQGESERSEERGHPGVTDCELVKPEPATARSSRREDGREESNGHINYRTLVCKIFLSLPYALPFIGVFLWGLGLEKAKEKGVALNNPLSPCGARFADISLRLRLAQFTLSERCTPFCLQQAAVVSRSINPPKGAALRKPNGYSSGGLG